MSKMKEHLPSMNNLEKFLDENVRPYLASHNGNIEILNFKNGVLKLKFLGACVNCSDSQETFDNKISKLLKEEFAEIDKIKIITGVSDNLIEHAKKILKQRK